MKRAAVFFALLILVQTSYGAIAPFQLPWMNEQPGTLFNTKDYPDGIFVIHAYFYNCPINHEFEPKVDKLANDYSNESRVRVLDLGADKLVSYYEQWISNHKPNHPVLMDADRAVIGQLGTTQYPTTYVLDCKGNVKFERMGNLDGGELTELHGVVDQLLKEECHI